MAKVSRTALALQDLDDIWLYIARDNPDAADRWLDILAEKALMLADQSLIGRLRPELSPEVRSFPVRAYILYYRPTEAGIELLRVLHASRDVQTGDV